MLLWSGKSKYTTAHALPMRTSTHILSVHLVYTIFLVPDPRKFSDLKKLPSDPLSLFQYSLS